MIIGTALWCIVVLGAFPLAGAESGSQARVGYLAERGRPPVEYVLATLRSHRVVILGEAHWIRHDSKLVFDLVPSLREAGVTTIALEVLPASAQERIDRLMAADAWSPEDAMAILREASWPYREMLGILRSVWGANHGVGGSPLHVLTLGPGGDWRERLLPAGRTYDSFMADLVASALADKGSHVLVYCGAHHGFTRYYQPEEPRNGRVDHFLDRMGNRLWRSFGDDVFLVSLHRPLPCTGGACLPFDGAIDCAAASHGRAVGFDIAGSPFAELRMPRGVLYAGGYADLRLVDFSDGWIWSGPIESWQSAEIIPLPEFAPDAAALAEALVDSPFEVGPNPTRAAIEAVWQRETAKRREFLASRGWTKLADWRTKCGHKSESH
jgi:hypothetical protein